MTYPEALHACRRLIGARIRRTMRATHAHITVNRGDLEQAARIGVWYAWRGYDAERGASFATWAEKWIRAYVEREAWGAHHTRHGAKAEMYGAMLSVDMPIKSHRKMTLGDVVPDPKPSPERVAEDRQRLAVVRRVLLAKSPRAARFDVRAAMRRHLAGENLRDIADDVGVSFQAVALHVTKRREVARQLLEAA